jgi:benzoyl-CoA reductase/2-hydroxyglutaryl-CoA dehydratase subunit BcrC/BadD/HgdB
MNASAFEELRAAFDEPFAAIGRDPTRDRESVVVSWPSVPVEVVRAAGFSAVFARGRDTPTPAADRVLEADLFPNRLHQLVEAALTGRLRNVAAVIVPRSSDPDYKCFLYLRELVRRGVAAAPPPVLLFDLLHADGSDAAAYNAARTRAFAAQLAELGGRALKVDGLKRAIASANGARAAARRLHAQRTGAPRIAGSDALPLLGAFWQLEPERYASLACAAAESAARRAPLEGPRVLIAGAPVDGTALHVSIEAAGGIVVAELSPFGGCGTSTDVELGEDSLASVAEHYRRESLDARLPVMALMRRLGDLLDGIEAVVISLPPDDASFGWDYPRVRDLLAARTIPHIVLRGDPVCGTSPADRERIHALLGSSRFNVGLSGG